jgi:hypothetical protein
VGLPWQRVVAAGGRIALPGERGLEQRFRLEAEGVKFSGKKVRMKECEFKFGKAAGNWQLAIGPAKAETGKRGSRKKIRRRL